MSAIEDILDIEKNIYDILTNSGLSDCVLIDERDFKKVWLKEIALMTNDCIKKFHNIEDKSLFYSQIPENRHRPDKRYVVPKTIGHFIGQSLKGTSKNPIKFEIETGLGSGTGRKAEYVQFTTHGMTGYKIFTDAKHCSLEADYLGAKPLSGSIGCRVALDELLVPIVDAKDLIIFDKKIINSSVHDLVGITYEDIDKQDHNAIILAIDEHGLVQKYDITKYGTILGEKSIAGQMYMGDTLKELVKGEPAPVKITKNVLELTKKVYETIIEKFQNRHFELYTYKNGIADIIDMNIDQDTYNFLLEDDKNKLKRMLKSLF